MSPVLPSLKHSFPFDSGTTSYLYPFETDNLTRNVEIISEAVDAIQLLFFGKNYLDELLTQTNLEALKKIQTEKKVRYCIHLPTDFDLLNPVQDHLEKTLKGIEKILKACKDLEVNYYILHIDRCENFTYPEISWNEKTKKRFDICLQAITALFEKPSSLCIENTSRSLEEVKEEIEANHVSVCCDLGHLMLQKQSFDPMLTLFKNRTPVIHLHGVQKGKDHLALPCLPKEDLQSLKTFLKTYQGTVILEVFNEKDFISSALWMKENLQKR